MATHLWLSSPSIGGHPFLFLASGHAALVQLPAKERDSILGNDDCHMMCLDTHGMMGYSSPANPTNQSQLNPNPTHQPPPNEIRFGSVRRRRVGAMKRNETTKERSGARLPICFDCATAPKSRQTNYNACSVRVQVGAFFVVAGIMQRRYAIFRGERGMSKTAGWLGDIHQGAREKMSHNKTPEGIVVV